jgi:hypothetical protein
MDFVSITLENDFFAGYDRHYTNGVQVAFLADRGKLPPAIAALPPLSWSTDPHIVFAVGQRIYTPADIGRDDPDPEDRPYAGWLYGLADVQTRSGPAIDHFTVTLGVVGPASGGRHTQSIAHHLLHDEPARGWNRQLSNEPTFGLGYELSWPAIMRTRLGKHTVDLALRAGATVGNALTYADAGAVLRYGANLPSDLPANHISLGPSRDGFRGTPARGWYVWAGVDGRAVGRNIFLDGNTFGDSASVHRKPFGYDVQVGAVAAWPQARVAFSVVQRSREFDGQPSPDRFGQLSVSYGF